MEEIIINGAAASAAIWGVISAIRSALTLPDRVIPLMAIGGGIAWQCGVKLAEVTGFEDLNWAYVVLLGIISGLAAGGIHSNAKTFREGLTERQGLDA